MTPNDFRVGALDPFHNHDEVYHSGAGCRADNNRRILWSAAVWSKIASKRRAHLMIQVHAAVTNEDLPEQAQNAIADDLESNTAVLRRPRFARRRRRSKREPTASLRACGPSFARLARARRAPAS